MICPHCSQHIKVAGITQKQRDLLSAIVAYYDEHKISPRISDLMEMLNTRARGGIVQRLNELERAGLISRVPAKPRSIQLL